MPRCNARAINWLCMYFGETGFDFVVPWLPIFQISREMFLARIFFADKEEEEEEEDEAAGMVSGF
jgi:hypothetical protein